MNGAIGLFAPNIMITPNNRSTTIMGASQNFFLSFKKNQRSDKYSIKTLAQVNVYAIFVMY
jgi:hypothetical protein